MVSGGVDNCDEKPTETSIKIAETISYPAGAAMQKATLSE
jgi:hypothetical protein